MLSHLAVPRVIPAACVYTSDSMFVSMQDQSLGDDTVLDKINLAEPDQYELPELSAEEQAVILGVW